MSGGIAYVLDATGNFAQRLNPGMVDLEALDGGRLEDRAPDDRAARHVHEQPYAKTIQATLDGSRSSR